MRILRLNIRKIKSFLILGLFLAACSTVPLTGRKQLNMMNNAQLVQMSLTMYNKVLKTEKISTNTPDVQMIKRCGKRISKAVETYLAQNNLSHLVSGYDWRFNLIEDNRVNAWCMPGGYVAFYTGILPICEDENGVAVVMGHEVAHAIARHGNERMSQGMIAQGLGVGLSVALQNKPTITRDLAMQAFGLGSSLGILSYSRTHELEADHMGLIFMAMAGYDPKHAPKFWKRMAENSKNKQKPPEFLSTHPEDVKRIARLNKHMPDAMNYYTSYRGGPD